MAKCGGERGRNGLSTGNGECYARVLVVPGKLMARRGLRPAPDCASWSPVMRCLRSKGKDKTLAWSRFVDDQVLLADFLRGV